MAEIGKPERRRVLIPDEAPAAPAPAPPRALLPIAGFFVTVLTLLSVGGICIYASVICGSSFSALVASYSIVLPVAFIGVFVPGCFISSPVAFMMSLEMQLGAGQFCQLIWPQSYDSLPMQKGGAAAVLAMTLIYAVPHVLIAVFCIWGAVRSLRSFSGVRPLERWLEDWEQGAERPKKRPARPAGESSAHGGLPCLPTRRCFVTSASASARSISRC